MRSIGQRRGAAGHASVVAAADAAGWLTTGYLIMAGIFGLFALEERGTPSAVPAAARLAGDVPAADAVPSATLTSGEDLLFVNGTLMRGLGLHHNLEGAEFVGAVRTAPPLPPLLD